MRLIQIITVIEVITSVQQVTCMYDGNIEIVPEEKIFPCNTGLTLSCKMKEIPVNVEWSYKDNTESIAGCVRSECWFNHFYDAKFTFTYEEDHKRFNLTFVKLTMEDNGITLFCSSGSHHAFRTIHVRVSPGSKLVNYDKLNGTSKYKNKHSPESYAVTYVIVSSVVVVVVVVGVVVFYCFFLTRRKMNKYRSKYYKLREDMNRF